MAKADHANAEHFEPLTLTAVLVGIAAGVATNVISELIKKALAIKGEFKDRYSQAGTYHQLGRVAEEQRRWAEAEQYYKQALAIKGEFKDRYAQAKTYHELGIVAQRRLQEVLAQEVWQHRLDAKKAGHIAALGEGGAVLQAGAGDQRRVQGPVFAGRNLSPARQGRAGAAALGGGGAVLPKRPENI